MTTTIDLEELCGLRWLSARGEFVGSSRNGYAAIETARVALLRLDDVLYWFQEDPNDGYRSMLSHVRIVEPNDDVPPGTLIEFPKRLVSCVVRTQPDEDAMFSTSDRVLMGTDEATGRVLFEIGTENTDDYYPSFISYWNPPPLEEASRSDRIKIGTSVLIVHRADRDRGYVKQVHKMRQNGNGLTGIIVTEHDSHGLCYDVKCPSGIVITYDREELVEVVS